jgi:hypothetical protein
LFEFVFGSLIIVHCSTCLPLLLYFQERALMSSIMWLSLPCLFFQQIYDSI